MAVRAAIYRKKSNPLKGKVIDYKDIKTLSHYITERGKIVPSRISGVDRYNESYFNRKNYKTGQHRRHG